MLSIFIRKFPKKCVAVFYVDWYWLLNVFHNQPVVTNCILPTPTPIQLTNTQCNIIPIQLNPTHTSQFQPTTISNIVASLIGIIPFRINLFLLFPFTSLFEQFLIGQWTHCMLPHTFGIHHVLLMSHLTILSSGTIYHLSRFLLLPFLVLTNETFNHKSIHN